ncbi:hypothetical protein S40285_00263, partial [Stachybotrys chlorohalonatus IBT 40285]
MTYTILGKPVGDIGYGMMGITFGGKPLPEEEAFAAIKAALESGCNYFNGGDFYGTPEYNSLTLLRKYYEKYPEDADRIVLNVKGTTVNLQPTGDREGVITSVENSLRWLGPIGRIDQFEPARKDLNHDYEEVTLKTINEYVQAGKIGAIAVSEINANTLRSAAKKFKITSVEVELSLFCPEPLRNGILDAAAELDIPVLAYSPLGRGFLGGQLKSPDDIPEGDYRSHLPRYQGDNFYKNLELVDKVNEIAVRKGCTPGQIAINWILAISRRPGMPKIIPIPGSTNPNRIRENATKVDLTQTDMEDIDKILDSFVSAGDRYPAPAMRNLE